MEIYPVEVISLLLNRSRDFANGINSIKDFDKIPIDYREPVDGVVFKNGRLITNKNITLKDKKVILSFLNGEHPLISLINDLTSIIPSANILDFVNVNNKLPNLFNFKYSNLCNLMRSLGYIYCNNDSKFEEYPDLIFGKINAETSVVFNSSDNTCVFITTSDLNEALLSHEYDDILKSFNTKSLTKNTTIHSGTIYKLPMTAIEKILNKYKEK